MLSFRLVFRSLGRTPLVTAVAVLSLALGIGANAAIFSIFERMILRPLPVSEPQQLVNLLAPGPKPGSQSTTPAGGMDAVFSYPMFRDLERTGAGLEGLAAHRSFAANLSNGAETVSAGGLLVSGGYFGVLGLRPAAGRLIQRADDTTPGSHPWVVLSHSYWRDGFAERPSVVGESLVVNGLAMTILGVAPAGFEGTTLGYTPKVFVPISMRGAMVPGWEGFENRRSYWLYLFGRLAPPQTLEQASAAINIPYRGLIREVELALQEGLSEARKELFGNKEILLEEGWQGQSYVHGELRRPLQLLLGLSGLVFLIACANLANLWLVRAASRSGEISLRLSLGARRFQVVTQLLGECLVLAIAGCGLGLLVAWGTLAFVSTLLPADSVLTSGFEFGLSFLFLFGGLFLVTALAGLFPALHATRDALAVSLKAQGGRTSGSKRALRFRGAMVSLQIALSMALLVSAGLFSKSLLNVSRVDLGMVVEPVVTFGLTPELNGYSFAESRDLFERVVAEVGALPGVAHVVGSRVPLITGNSRGTSVSIQGLELGPDADIQSQFNEVGPSFFSTLGIPLLAGRDFSLSDDQGAPKVAIVNEAFTRKFGLGRDVLGRRILEEYEIIGLVADSHYSQVKQEVPPVFFLPYRQEKQVGAMTFYVRAAGDPKALVPTLRRVIKAFDPSLPIENLQTFQLQIEENVYSDRLLSLLSVAFSVLATLLAAIGLYGVMAYSVSQRTREIGLRMALGADAGRVRRLVMERVGWMFLWGMVLGLLGALALGRAGRSLLFDLEGNDPTIFALAALALTTIALLAGLLPANRAARIEPMQALRDE